MLNCTEAPPGVEALNRLKSTDPPVYLTPSPELSHAARVASQFLFSSLRPFTPKSPFDKLLVDGFDAEQIWQQIDLQSQPLSSTLRREVRKFEKNPSEISALFGERREKSKGLVSGKENGDVEQKSDDFEGLEGVEDEEFEGIDDDDGGNVDGDEDEDMGEDGEEREDEEEDEKEGGVEDRFLKINELEEYLKADEAREYGLNNNKKKGGSKAVNKDDEEEEEEDEEEDYELGAFGLDDGGEDEDGDDMENSRYEDFFGGGKKVAKKRKSGLVDGIFGSNMDDDKTDEEDFDNQKKENMSTHEKELEKQRLKIEEMEKANLEPKTWTMQGEVTAAKRPKNSALEVDLDFEHNVRPAPVITEEVTASIEELIKKRILEGNFDDVQKPPPLTYRAPKEIKELDENKSKKGLAEIYEDEYVQKTGLVSTALSFSDEQKKEASTLFKKLCLKLDALSHFHFTPKPIIEDMSVQANAPALAMEEIAPLAVSDAAMLAPEEVFAGKGDIKEEAELTQADRKRRRANKKRKFKAETARKMSKKALESTSTGPLDGKEGS